MSSLTPQFLQCSSTHVLPRGPERQKKLIISSERRSLKSTTFIIIFGHKQAKVLLMKHIWKLKEMYLLKRRICSKIAKGHFFKVTETARWEPPSTKGRLFRTFSSYSLSFNSGLCNHRNGYCPSLKRFIWFLKFLYEANFINNYSQSEIYFTLWAFAYCCLQLQASSDWR